MDEDVVGQQIIVRKHQLVVERSQMLGKPLCFTFVKPCSQVPNMLKFVFGKEFKSAHFLVRLLERSFGLAHHFEN